MKIAYCGYDFFIQCLQALLTRGDNVYRVFTFNCDNHFDFNQYTKEVCKKESLPLTDNPINPKTLEQLRKDGCELLITAAWDVISIL